MHRIYSFIWILLILVTKVSAEGFDFTCTSNQPLLNPGDGDNIVTAFPAGNAAGSSVNFSRAVDTRNGNGLTLPADSRIGDHPSEDDAKRLIMDSTGGKERIGIFYCEATKGGTTYKIPTIILHQTGDPKPVHKTVTANPGDSVTLEVTTTMTDNFGWYKDGRDNKLNPNEKQLTFDPVSTSDAGFYECAIDGERTDGTQAMIRLIVTECPANLWSPPLCDQHCPICYNGGVCDDKFGACICGAGFGGSFCETTFGKNTFGQDGTFKCSSSNDDACRDKLICQLDPYGCSCTAGYHGRDCDQDCNLGTFGADCKQTCHCQPGDTCDKATGECSSSCDGGWTGSNCQVCDVRVTDIQISNLSPTSFDATWTASNNPDSYEVDYQLINEDNCMNIPGERSNAYSGSGTTTTISNLISYSTYVIHVKPKDARCDGNGISKMVATLSSDVPSAAPTGVTSTSTKTSIDFMWDTVPCGSRGGLITSYDYLFDGSSGSSHSTSVRFESLLPCTSYTFKVRAVNGNGPGEYGSEVTGKTQNEVPGAVTNLLVNSVESISYQLRAEWNAPHPLCATQYHIEYQLTNLEQCNSSAGPRKFVNTISGTSILMNGLQAYSTYKVFVSASNTLGMTEAAEFGVTEEKVPSDKPSNVKSTNTKPNSLTFSWQEVPCGSRGGALTYNYELSGDIFKSGDVQGSSVKIDGLTACSTYRFKVRATNSRGSSQYTDEILASTADEAPGAVTSLTVTQSQDNLRATWISPQPPCADKFSVSIELTNRDQCDDSGGSKIFFGETVENSITITGLVPYSTYIVYVQPINNIAGVGEEKDTNAITKSAVPTAAPASITPTSTPTSIKFTWNEVPCGNRHGLVTSYNYQFDKASGSTNSTSAQFDGLITCTSHTFKVLAINNAGNGPYSTEVAARTQDEAPGVVTSLNVVPIQNGLQVSWSPPHPPCADKFKVSTKLTNQDQCNDSGGPKTIFTETIDNSITITGLIPFSTYNVYIQGVNNEVGGGAEDYISGNTANAAPSAPPANIVPSVITNTSIAFEWERVPCGSRGGPNEFTYQMIDSEGKTIAEDDTPNLTVNIEKLIPCTNYTFKVKAFNDVGSGDHSEPFGVETDIGVLGPVQSLASDKTTATSVTLTWDAPNENLCSTDSYYIEYALMNRDQCEEISNPSWVKYGYQQYTNVTITGLEPYSTYQVRVYPVNDLEFGAGSTISLTTDESVPSGPPTHIQNFPIDEESISFSWGQPSCGNRSGDDLEYTISLNPGNYESTTRNELITINGLNGCTKYIFTIVSSTSIGEGPCGMLETSTLGTVPDRPSSLTTLSRSMVDITVTWTEPITVPCPITQYTISIRTVHKPYDEGFVAPLEPDKIVQLPSYNLQNTFVGLFPSTEYEFEVFAHTAAGIGDSISQNYTTLPADDDKLGSPLQDIALASGDTTLVLEIPQLTGAESPYLTEFHIKVEAMVGKIMAFACEPPCNYTAGTVPKSEVQHQPLIFVVGSGETNENPPLIEGMKYRIYVGSCSVIREDSDCIWSEPMLHGYIENDEKDASTIDATIFITTVVLMACVIAVSVIVNLKICHDKRSGSRKNSSSTMHKQDVITKGHELEPYTNLGVVVEPSPYEEFNTTKPVNWAIKWSDLTLSDNVLGKGSFGEVRKGTCKKDGRNMTVAVKSLHSNATAADKADFKSEYETMKRIGNHRNVVCLVGACEHKGTLYVALEYVTCGDLRTYLRTTRRRDQTGTAAHQLSPRMLLQFAYDVANGMSHLSSIGIIHRDVAARNILLDEDLVAKVSDFGMSRGENIYVKTSKTRIPTRWLAIESLCYSTYTTKSDVWSFAVVVWEIATLGATPYSGIASRDIPQYLTEGYRMPKPASLDPAVYSIMTECWNANPEERPSFARIALTFSDILSVKKRAYLDTSVYANVKFPEIEPERDDN